MLAAFAMLPAVLTGGMCQLLTPGSGHGPVAEDDAPEQFQHIRGT